MGYVRTILSLNIAHSCILTYNQDGLHVYCRYKMVLYVSDENYCSKTSLREKFRSVGDKYVQVWKRNRAHCCGFYRSRQRPSTVGI